MIRAAIEAAVTLFVVLLVRTIITSIIKALSGASSSAASSARRDAGRSASPPPTENARASGVLQRDPVCGTFVAESTHYQRQVGREVVYYCSSDCLEKHSYVAQ